MTTTVTPDDASDGRSAAIAAPTPVTVAWRPVGVLAGALGVLMLVTSGFYGLFGDEAYFITAGQHPAVGYADQPPLVPLLAAALDALAPGNLVVLRLPSTLITAATVVVAALVAAELGGRRRAQLLAAGATAISPYLLATGHLLATTTVDAFCWAVVTWLVVRWIRLDRDGTRRDRLLLVAGLVTALALFSKILIPVLVGGLLVGVLVAGPRRILRRPLLWVGMVLAAVSTVPTWIWQAQHGWPQLVMGQVVNGESGLFGSRWQFLPRALWFAGVVPGAVLAIVGLWALLRLDALRPYRAAGIAVALGVAAMIVAGGRPYYAVGYFVILFAAGAVAVQSRTERPSAWWRWTLTPACYAVSAVLAVLAVLPVGPSSWRTTWDFGAMGQVGWTELSTSVAGVYAALPPEERRTTVVMPFSYWYASSLAQQPATRDLPIYSPHRGFGYFDFPADGAATALLVGRVRWAARFCSRLRPLPTYQAPVVDPVNDQVPMALCTPSRPWAEAWPTLRYMD